MNPIAFVDIEIEPNTGHNLDIGSIKNDGSSFHKSSVADFVQFLTGTQFICGHNIFHHDIKYVGKAVNDAGIDSGKIIDTLPSITITPPGALLICVGVGKASSTSCRSRSVSSNSIPQHCTVPLQPDGASSAQLVATVALPEPK